MSHCPIGITGQQCIKIDQYEIASYGTLRRFAVTRGLTEAVLLLKARLNEEKAADEKISEVAKYAVNINASQGEA